MKNVFMLSCCILLFCFSCKEDVDLCETIICENNGTCNEGSCDCPPGYGGLLCESLVNAKEVRINKVIVTYFLENNWGIEWDENDGPDLYLRLGNGNNVFSKDSDVILDCIYGQEYEFEVDWVLDGSKVGYDIHLLDDDGINDFPENLGERFFYINDFRAEKPSIIELSYSPSGTIYVGYRFEGVEWIFE